MKTKTTPRALALLITLAAFLCGGLNLAAAPADATRDTIAELYKARPKNGTALSKWQTANAAAITTAAASLQTLGDGSLSKTTAADYLALKNAGKTTWDTGADIAKKYNTNIYYERFATLDELQAAFATASPLDYGGLLKGLQRLNRTDLADTQRAAYLGRGCTANDYRKWFTKRLVTLSPKARSETLAAEIKALYASPATPAKAAWLNELATIKQAEALLNP